MKKIYLYIIVSLLSVEMFSQQDPQFAHNADNHLYTNPGFAGMGSGICAYAMSRQQWVGFDGAPATTLAGVHSGIKVFGYRGGVGLSIVDDRFEFEKDFQAKLSFAFHKKVGLGLLGIGINGGVINKDLNAQWVPPETADDDLLPQGQVRKLVADFGLGVFYKLGERFYAGISVSHINRPAVKYPNLNTASFLRTHYFGTVGYNFRLINSPFEMQPSVFVKFDGTKFQYSANLTALYNKKFYVGVSYRNKEAIIPMLGIRLMNGLKVGYAYEISLTRIMKVSKGSHEIFVAYCFDLGRGNTDCKYKSILYL